MDPNNMKLPKPLDSRIRVKHNKVSRILPAARKVQFAQRRGGKQRCKRGQQQNDKWTYRIPETVTSVFLKKTKSDVNVCF